MEALEENKRTANKGVTTVHFSGFFIKFLPMGYSAGVNDLVLIV